MRTELLQESTVRKAIDADWSGKKKAAVAGGASVFAIGALALGVWAFQAARPLSIPETTDQAIAVLSSAKFDRLPSDRKAQITAAARGLLADLPDDQRRELFRDEDNRDAMRTLMEASMEDMSRRYARGEELDEIRRGMGFGGGRPGGGAGGRRGGGPPGSDNPRDNQRTPDDELTPEQQQEREQRRADRMAQFQQRIAEAFNAGSAQSAALRGEMFKRMRAEREASGEPQRRR